MIMPPDQIDSDYELRSWAHAHGLSRLPIAFVPLVGVDRSGPDTAEIRFMDSNELHGAPVRRFKRIQLDHLIPITPSPDVARARVGVAA